MSGPARSGPEQGFGPDSFGPDSRGHFGPYGGRFVPEALVAALDELDRGLREGPPRPGLPARAARAADLLHRPAQPAHRGAPVRRARRRRAGPAQARGPQPHRLAQDQQRPRPGAAGPRMGKTPGHRRDRRRPARRRDGHRGCAARPRVHGLHGRGGHPPPGAERRPDAAARRRGRAGERRQPHPQGRDQRGDARLGRPTSTTRTTCSARSTGPHPFPAMVRDFQRVIGDEAREQVLDADRTAARRGRRLRRRRLQRDGHLHRRSSTTRTCGCYGFEAGGEGIETGRHAAPMAGGSPGVLHGTRTYVLQDDDGQTVPSPLDLGRAWTTRASGRSTPGCTTPGRATYAPVTDAEAMEAFALLCRTEGIIPAIESAHALAGALTVGRELATELTDADRAGQPVRPRRQGRRHRRDVVRGRHRRGDRRVRDRHGDRGSAGESAGEGR